MPKETLKNQKETNERRNLKMRKMFKTKNGITLIALVVTIVVLLILAGVSISLLLDENGIIKKSKDARREYEQAKTNEQTDFDNVSDWIDDAVGKINWEKILNDANKNPDKYKHSEQSNTNGDIGIGTDGKPVNLDLWTYKVINENEITLGYFNGCNYTPGYQNSNIVNEKIQGKVPQYIKINGNDGFYAVTSMCGTFSGCTSLTTAPEIPSSVTDMTATFYRCTSLTTASEIPSSVTSVGSIFFGCTSLTTAPEIPSSVTSMYNTFNGCTSLTTAPEIPSSVTEMMNTFDGCKSLTTAPEIPSSVTEMMNTFYGCKSLTTAPEIPLNVTNMLQTFSDCTSLTTAPEIPSSVTDMESTFSGCTKLTGNLIINANPTNYRWCLEYTATADDANLVVSGSSTVLNEIIATKSENSHITKAQ